MRHQDVFEGRADWSVEVGSSLDWVCELPERSVHVCVTSPPYFGLRSYLSDDDSDKLSEIGTEETPDQYVEKLVRLFRGVRRALHPSGQMWLNIGDTYASSPGKGGNGPQSNNRDVGYPSAAPHRSRTLDGIKPKDLIGIPWMVAFALRQPYVVPTCVKSEIDRAWLAAMFDGEGCIGIRRFDSYREEKQQVYQDGFVVYTVVTNNDRELLERCEAITGLGKIRLKAKAGGEDSRKIRSRRDSFGWRPEGNDAVKVICAIYPYLIAKRKQACIAYTLDRLNKNGHGSRAVPAEIQEKKRLCWEMIKQCNQRQPVDLPNWIEEPKQQVEPGWYLRQACPWVKRNPMPESVIDRPNTACEMVFLLTKRPDYFFDMGAVKRKSAVGWATTAGIVPKGKYADEIKLPAEVLTSAGNPSRNNRTDEIQLDRHWRNPDFWFDSVGMLMAGHLDGTDDQTLLGFDVAPAQHSGAHTAVFPKGLIAPMILCGTSSRGVCSVCGAPRIPVEEKTKLLRDRPNEYIKRQSGGKENNINQTVAGVSSKTVGWEPSCECEDRQWVRPVVMDPFTGSGTTGAVARFYGRRFIGCELNPEYAADARRRIGNVDPPLI